MSSQQNTYVIVGKRLDYREYKDIIASRNMDEDSFLDNAFKGISHHSSGLCVLADGMCGKYAIVGRVLAKSEVNRGLNEPYVIDFYDLFTKDDCITRAVIEALDEQFGIQMAWDEFEVITLTHYR